MCPPDQYKKGLEHTCTKLVLNRSLLPTDCSQDLWLGNTTTSSGYHMRGAAILAAIFDFVRASGSPAIIVLAGMSAGGLGAANSVLEARKLFGMTTKIFLLLDSAYVPDIETTLMVS